MTLDPATRRAFAEWRRWERERAAGGELVGEIYTNYDTGKRS